MRISEYNGILLMVDCWFLLGSVWWRTSFAKCSSSLLVYPVPISFYVFFFLLCIDYDLRYCRLSVVFLAFDVFFAIFCVVLACLIGIALCCCLPCIIAILYAVAGQVSSRVPFK